MRLYRLSHRKECRPSYPPQGGEGPHVAQRNQSIQDIGQEGVETWKKTGYHQRSLNEVPMFRYKTIFGGTMSARQVSNQLAEVKMKCLL